MSLLAPGFKVSQASVSAWRKETAEYDPQNFCEKSTLSRCKPLSAERQALIAARYEASNAFGILAYLAASACWTLALPAPGESIAGKGGAL